MPQPENFDTVMNRDVQDIEAFGLGVQENSENDD